MKQITSASPFALFASFCSQQEDTLFLQEIAKEAKTIGVLTSALNPGARFGKVHLSASSKLFDLRQLLSPQGNSRDEHALKQHGRESRHDEFKIEVAAG